ncbi:MAG: hypothetical protein LBF43_00030 [Puniceicoccales bacterium]|nr:hypothetical protein [Puniceicoccales bacterium]
MLTNPLETVRSNPIQPNETPGASTSVGFSSERVKKNEESLLKGLGSLARESDISQSNITMSADVNIHNSHIQQNETSPSVSVGSLSGRAKMNEESSFGYLYNLAPVPNIPQKTLSERQVSLPKGNL